MITTKWSQGDYKKWSRECHGIITKTLSASGFDNKPLSCRVWYHCIVSSTSSVSEIYNKLLLVLSFHSLCKFKNADDIHLSHTELFLTQKILWTFTERQDQNLILVFSNCLGFLDNISAWCDVANIMLLCLSEFQILWGGVVCYESTVCSLMFSSNVWYAQNVLLEPTRKLVE